MATSRTSNWSATAETGRFSASSTRKQTAMSSGRIAPRPAARAERADRGQRQHLRGQRQDRAARREIVGGRAGRGRDQHAVADQFGHRHAAVDRHLDLGGLAGFAQQRHFVDRGVGEGLAADRGRAHVERRDADRLGAGDALGEAGRAAIRSSGSRRCRGSSRTPAAGCRSSSMCVQRLEHEAVAAERDQRLGVVGVGPVDSAGAASSRRPARPRSARRAGRSPTRRGRGRLGRQAVAVSAVTAGAT